MSSVVGWDIGGVHLKAARAEGGTIVKAVEIAAPLRAGLEPLVKAFAEAKSAMGPADRNVVTMTGELADTFVSREEGVAQLATLAAAELPGQEVAIYAGAAGFVAPSQVVGHVRDIASANWHASAALVARTLDSALFIDMGSTTTDVVPVVDGRVAAQGYTDLERLACGELVYVGLVRSYLMAICERAPFRGRWTGLVNENFATIADVHRVLGTMPEGADRMGTADGRPKTPGASRARLARMVGADATDGEAPDWAALAAWFAEGQLRAVGDAAMLVLSRAQLTPDAPVVTAGSGAQVLAEVARRLGRPARGFATLIEARPEVQEAAAVCAPAAALALLASR